MEVGVRELKAKLSEYLRRAAEGEVVVVTDRGRPVARLVSYETGSSLQQGIEEGWIEPPRRTRLDPASRVRAKGSVLEVLDEDRG